MGIRTLYDAATIQARVTELGAQIARDYRGKDLAVVIVLKGAFVFGSDLVRAIDAPLTVDFLGCRSYGEATESSGQVQITHDLTVPIEGRDVLIVEDIVDTGLTMTYLLKALQARRPKSVKLASLLHKPARSRVPIEIDYLGFTIEDVFVIGYGLDHAEKYRNVPFVGVVES